MVSTCHPLDVVAERLVVQSFAFMRRSGCHHFDWSLPKTRWHRDEKAGASHVLLPSRDAEEARFDLVLLVANIARLHD